MQFWIEGVIKLSRKLTPDELETISQNTQCELTLYTDNLNWYIETDDVNPVSSPHKFLDVLEETLSGFGVSIPNDSQFIYTGDYDGGFRKEDGMWVPYDCGVLFCYTTAELEAELEYRKKSKEPL